MERASIMSDLLDENKWRLDKHIPLTLIAAMVLQTVFFTFWLSSNLTELRAELKQTSQRIEEIWRDRYTKEDARRDAATWAMQHAEYDRRLIDIETRLRALENGRRN